MEQSLAVEICVQDPEGVRIAKAAGAARVELCMALGVGGLTPSLAMIEACVAEGLPVHVLVRPRPGGFIYTQEDIAIVNQDITLAMAAGAAGVVIGALSPGAQSLDHQVMAMWRDTALQVNPAAEITVHRCVDVLIGAGIGAQEVAAMVRDLGVHRVLTSGGASVVGAGMAALETLSQSLDRQVEVMAGGGCRLDDIPALRVIGVDAVHLSARSQRTSAGPSGPGGGDDGFDVTDPDLVAQVIAAATQTPPTP